LLTGQQYSVVYLVKTDERGDTLWTRTYGRGYGDYAHSVQQTPGGGYIVAGYTGYYSTRGSDVYLIKVISTGDTLWTRTYGGSANDEGWAVQQTHDMGFIIIGRTFSFGSGQADVYFIKTDGQGSSGTETAEERGQRLEVRLTAKPNPFTSFATVPGQEKERFELYDITGRKVGAYQGDRIGEGLTPGVYFLRSTSSTTSTLRIVKIR
jgi:hypothetical protein